MNTVINPNTSQNHAAATIDIDVLLQDSYLLVVQLLHGASLENSKKIAEKCSQQIESVRRQLEQAGVSQDSIDPIIHAQCALFDESVLSRAKDDDHAEWAREPLQARYFNRHQAGVSLYEDMRRMLREPAADPMVLTAFHRVLMLGFKGRYRELHDPEREALVAVLNARVAPLKPSQTIVTQSAMQGRRAPRFWSRYPLAQPMVAGMLLVATWWGLDQVLGQLIATLVPGQE